MRVEGWRPESVPLERGDAEVDADVEVDRDVEAAVYLDEAPASAIAAWAAASRATGTR